ncbi:hypothetical protein [Mammaliicoccus fleurettii]|nr:hypothetical protein [Mammaliicoccus fleurettii]
MKKVIKKVNELKFNNNYQMSLEIFSAIGSGASIFGMIYEFFL